MNYAELPPTNYAKDAGIRGLKQIALQVRDHHTHEARVEIVKRYLAKFVARMNKLINPLTVEEQSSIERELMEIIAEEF